MRNEIGPWCAVVGDPISHSLSPVLHQAAFAVHDLNWTFTREQVPAGELAGWLSRQGEELKGLAVTMPHKQDLLKIVDAVDPLAAVVGAGNTLVKSAGLLTAFNTDVAGIVAALREVTGKELLPSPAVVLGTGATAASAIAALAEVGIAEVSLLGRSSERAHFALRAGNRMGVDVRVIPWSAERTIPRLLGEAQTVISTLPAKIADHLCDIFTPSQTATLLDVAYDPWPSVLSRHFALAGAKVAPGALMLLHQAVLQSQLLTGLPGPEAAMRAALRQSLPAGIL